MLNIFGRRREDIAVTKVKASRAIYANIEEHTEIEIKVLTPEGTLVLHLPPQLAHQLVTQVTTAYEAICPPMNRGGFAAQWNGMSD